jgi:hypothetical protein
MYSEHRLEDSQLVELFCLAHGPEGYRLTDFDLDADNIYQEVETLHIYLRVCRYVEDFTLGSPRSSLDIKRKVL